MFFISTKTSGKFKVDEIKLFKMHFIKIVNI